MVWAYTMAEKMLDRVEQTGVYLRPARPAGSTMVVDAWMGNALAMSMTARVRLYCATALTAALWLMLAEIDSLLRSIPAGSGQTFGMSTVKGIPDFQGG